MTLSVRVKLLFYMTVNIIIFTVVLFGINLFLTKKIYVNHKKNILLDSSQHIKDILENSAEQDYSAISFELSRLEKSIGASLFISTPEREIYYPPGGPPRLNPFYANTLTGGGTSFFMVMNDPNLDFETLRFQTKLENGIEVLIWLPMGEISESIGVFNKIIVMTALVIFLGSALWSLFISNRFTQPITQMNKIARKISRQDFSETLTVKGNDEIAQLSASINEISHKLSNSIYQLSIKNRQLENDIVNEKKLDKMRKEFVSNVSHELKTPIFLIQGYAEGLKKVSHLVEKRDFYCDVIMNETEKMDRLIKDLLDLAQLEAGMFTVEERPFDITDLVNHTLAKFKPVFEHKNIYLKVTLPEKLDVNADPDRTEQILVNYINNAINHLNTQNEIRVSVTADAQKARVAVFNSGENIPADEIDKLWISFYKADKSRSREYVGTGLGLSIVRAIQESHNNCYGVDNLEDGVAFWITLDLMHPL